MKRGQLARHFPRYTYKNLSFFMLKCLAWLFRAELHLLRVQVCKTFSPGLVACPGWVSSAGMLSVLSSSTYVFTAFTSKDIATPKCLLCTNQSWRIKNGAIKEELKVVFSHPNWCLRESCTVEMIATWGHGTAG